MIRRKLLSMFVICSMIITLLVPAASYGASFSDTKGHWADSYITKAVESGFVQGYPDGTFIPDKSVSRAEFTTMLNKALKNTATASISFGDVPSNEWYYQDVSKALAATYVAGYDDNTFRPSSPITRQEAAVMISRVVPTYGSSGNLNTYPDRGSIADWAYTAFQKVNGKKYIGAYDDGNLHPLDKLTRAQTAKIICDILDNESIVTYDPVVKSRTTLSNTIYSNGVTFHRDLDDDDATIDNCVVLGNLAVQGGDVVTVSNSRIAQSSVEKSASAVKLVVKGEAVISQLTAAKEAVIQTSGLTGGLYGSGINNLSTLSSSNITLQGTFPKVSVNGASAKLDIASGQITNLTVSSNANKSDITVESGASVNTVDVNAESYFHGTGSITRMNANASGITYEKKPSSVVADSRYDEPTLVDPVGDIKFSPENGATKVKLNTTITITFSQAMTLYNGKEITSSNIEDFVFLREKTASGTKLSFTATINNAKKIITITPDATLIDDTKYFVVIDKNELMDSDGVGNKAQSISFSTGSDGFTTFSPKEDETNISKTVSPTITFSEAIETYAGDTITPAYLRDTAIIFAENSKTGTKVAFTASINSAKTVITITPTKDLTDGQKYYIGIVDKKLRTQKNSTSIPEASVTWTVNKAVSDIEVRTQPTKLSYNVDEKLNLAGLVVRLNYTDSKYEDVTYSEANFKAKGITTSPVTSAALKAENNNKPITIYAGGKTATTNNLTVITQTVTSVAILTQPTKLSYSDGSTLDLTGLVVKLTYTSGTSENVTYSAANFSNKGITANPANGTTLTVASHNNKPVSISVGGKSAATNNLTVTAKTNPVIQTNPTLSGTLTYGDTLNNTKLTLAGGTANVPGVFSLTNETARTMPNAGPYNNSLTCTFTPNDTNTYNVVQGTVSVNVSVDKKAVYATVEVTIDSSDNYVTHKISVAEGLLSGDDITLTQNDITITNSKASVPQGDYAGPNYNLTLTVNTTKLLM